MAQADDGDHHLLAQCRCDLAAAPEDLAMQELIKALAKRSPDFRRWWEQPNHEEYRYGIGTILDTEAYPREYEHATLLVDEHRHLRMVVYLSSTASSG